MKGRLHCPGICRHADDLAAVSVSALSYEYTAHVSYHPRCTSSLLEPEIFTLN